MWVELEQIGSALNIEYCIGYSEEANSVIKKY
jgi:hypothetical protein